MHRRSLIALFLGLALCTSSIAGATTWEELTAHLRAPKVEVKKPAPKKEPEKRQLTTLGRGISNLYRQKNKNLSLEQADQLAALTVKQAEAYNVDPALLAGIVVVESRANVAARNKSMLGLCQVHWGVHAQSIKKSFPHIKSSADMMKAENNLQVGAWILSGYLERAGGDEVKALTRYLGRHSSSYIKRLQTMKKDLHNFS